MFIIAINTVKEFIRNKIVYLIWFLAIWMIFLSLILSVLALSEGNKIIIDFSLMTIEAFWLISTLFLGSYLIYNEITKNTILLILSKNPSRRDFILWKFFWFAIIIAILFIILTIAFFIALLIHNIPFDMNFIWAIILSYIKILIVLGLIIFFSTFISPFLTFFITFAIYIISHTLVFVKFYTTVSKKVAVTGTLSHVITFFYWLFPNFHDLSMKEYLYSPNLWWYTMEHIWISLLWNIIYLIILLYLAIIIFNKREF